MATGIPMKHKDSPDDEPFYAVTEDQVRVLEKKGWKRDAKASKTTTAAAGKES